MAEKLRVVHMIPWLGKGGAERLVADICYYLSKRDDVDVTLVSIYEENHYQHITYSINWKVITGRFVPSITGKPQNNTAALRQFFNEFKPHIIHCHLFETIMYASGTDYRDAAYVFHSHNNIPQLKKLSLNTFSNKQQLTNYFDKRLILKKADKSVNAAFVAVSEDTKAYLIENLPASFKSKVVYIQNAISYDNFIQFPLPDNSTDEIRLINVGTLIAIKNQKFLVRVAHLIKSRGYNVTLKLFGFGYMEAEIKALITELGCEAYVFAPGTVNHIENELANANMYVHASVTESFGLAIAEALAIGLPVIAHDGVGNRELNVEGKTGYLINELSEERFADTIINLHINKQLYKEMSTFARAFAANFDMKNYTEKLVGIYRKLLAKQSIQ